MISKRVCITLLVTGLLLLDTYADFPQIHRALPGANGKPGYRVGSTNSADNSIQNKHQHGGMGTDKSTLASRRQKTMDFASEWSQAAFYSIISCMLVGLSGILPLVVIPLEAGPYIQNGAGSSMLKLLLSFAVGSLLGDVFLHLLPEAWATVNSAPDPHWAHTMTGLWVIFGLLAFMTLEKIFSETEESEEDEQESEVKQELNGNVVKQTTEDDATYNLRSRAKSHQNGTSNGSANGAFTNGQANGVHKQNGTAKNGHAVQEEESTEEHNQEQKKTATIYTLLAI